MFPGLYTWLDCMEGVAITIYVDNEEVRCSRIAGTPKCKEIALMIARMRQVAAIQMWGLLFRRVETKANLADRPTREDFTFLEILNATWCKPTLPEWIHALWNLHELEGGSACL